MLRKFPSKFSKKTNVVVLVVIFALIFVLGAVVSSRPNDIPLQSSTNSNNNENKTLANTHEVASNDPTVDDKTAEKEESVPYAAGVNGVQTNKPIEQQVTTPEGIELAAREIKVVSKVTPQDELRCPHGTYINASDNEVCRPFVNFPNPTDGTSPCNGGAYDNIHQLEYGICVHRSAAE